VHIKKFVGIQKFLQEVDILKPNAVAVLEGKGAWLGLMCAVLFFSCGNCRWLGQIQTKEELQR
jgi:hypothetical protein